MPLSTINYASPEIVNNEISPPSTLTSSQVQLFLSTDQKYLHKSQLTIMASVVNSGLTSATFLYYIGLNSSSTATPSWVWYPVCLYNTSTGEITQRKVVMDSGSYSDGTSWFFEDDLPFSGCFAFQITGASNTGTPAFTLSVIGRDN